MAGTVSIFGKRQRYNIKESYSHDSKGVIRNSINELNPNVVRIEPLGPSARQAFLGPVHSTADALKLRMAYAMNPDSFKPFYGILTPSDLRELSIRFNSVWTEETGKSSFERAMQILKSPAVAMPLGAGVGETVGQAAGYGTTGFGVGTAAGALMSFLRNGKSDDAGQSDSLVGKLSSFVKNVSGRLGSSMELYGIDSSSTGAATMKTFSNSSMDVPSSLNFTWYMPEQEDLFRLSIHRLLQLAYVRSAYTDKNDFFERLKDATNSGMQQSFVNAKTLKDSLSGVGTAWKSAGDSVVSTGEVIAAQTPVAKKVVEGDNGRASDAVVNAVGSGVSVGNGIGAAITKMTDAVGGTIDENAREMGENGRFSNVDKQNVVDGMNGVVAKVLEAYMLGSTFLGANFVLVPNPVRVTVGNILDIEPMVITSVDITPSKELFVNSIGANIPVTMGVKVGLTQWMTPGPNHDFVHLIGDNLFYPIPGKKTAIGK